MANKILMIIPTRDRPDSIQEIYEQWNAPEVDLMIGLDSDNCHLYPCIEGLNYQINPRLRMGGTLNLLANKFCHDYEYIGFMGDDHRPRTPNWANILTERIGHLGIAYGNDGHQGGTLPTAVIMSSNIIQTLGYMSPPKLRHLYLDNSWKCWGEAINRLFYVPEVIIEHMHPAAGKGEWDAGYEEVNSVSMYAHDLKEFNEYMLNQFEKDMEKLRGI